MTIHLSSQSVRSVGRPGEPPYPQCGSWDKLEFRRYDFITQYLNIANINTKYKSPQSLVQIANVPGFATGSPMVAPLQKAARSSCPLLPLALSARFVAGVCSTSSDAAWHFLKNSSIGISQTPLWPFLAVLHALTAMLTNQMKCPSHRRPERPSMIPNTPVTIEFGASPHSQPVTLSNWLNKVRLIQTHLD